MGNIINASDISLVFYPALVESHYTSIASKVKLLKLIMNVSKTLRSINASTKSSVTFHNKSSRTVCTVWLNYDGAPVKYTELAPEKSYTQSTYVTHPWVVVELDSGFFNLMQVNGWTVFFPQISDTNVDISDNSGSATVLDSLAPQYHSIFSS